MGYCLVSQGKLANCIFLAHHAFKSLRKRVPNNCIPVLDHQTLCLSELAGEKGLACIPAPSKLG